MLNCLAEKSEGIVLNTGSATNKQDASTHLGTIVHLAAPKPAETLLCIVQVRPELRRVAAFADARKRVLLELRGDIALGSDFAFAGENIVSAGHRVLVIWWKPALVG